MNVFIVGISGKMGHVLCERATEFGCTVSGGLDKVRHPTFPTFSSANEVNVHVDAVIDFSRPVLLPEVILLGKKFACPCVLATTGYDKNDDSKIQELAKHVPVFRSENMSLGVNALAILTEQAASVLKNFDIEIIERHHNQKADAPSGTAKLLCRAAERGLDYSPNYVYGREGISKREQHEIGIHAIRGGTIVGEHEVAFCGNDETVTLTHSAGSRRIFADGALKAAIWLKGQKTGLYDMRDMLKL